MAKKKKQPKTEEQPEQEQIDGVTFAGVFAKATTTIDGGWNVTFAVSQNEALAIMQLSQFRHCLMQIAAVPNQN